MVGSLIILIIATFVVKSKYTARASDTPNEDDVKEEFKTAELNTMLQCKSSCGYNSIATCVSYVKVRNFHRSFLGKRWKEASIFNFEGSA